MPRSSTTAAHHRSDDVPSTRSAIDALLAPRSIAIVGASGRPNAMFGRPLKFLRKYEFDGPIYPVNPNYEHIDGVTCYPSLSAVPGPVDLVLSLVPAAATVELVRECGVVGVPVVIVFASGFAEAGSAGARLQDDMVAAARAGNVRVVGPNCQGVVHVPNRVVATFTPAVDTTLPEPQGIAYVGQSGAVGGSILDIAAAQRMGLSAWVSTGNQADVDHVEVAAFLVEQSDIFVVMLYLESLTDVQGYLALARRTRELGKHLVVLRSGKSSAGRRAAMSHTGAMLNADAPFELVSQAEGVVVVNDIDDFLMTSYALRWTKPPRGPRVGIVTTSGGAGSLTTDHLIEHGLEVENLAPETQSELAKLVPDFGAVANPVDITAQLINRGEEAFADVCTTTGRDSGVDVLVVVFTLITGEVGVRLADVLADIATSLDKPLFVVWLVSENKTTDGRDRFGRARIPVVSTLRGVASTVAALVRRASVPAPVDAREFASTLDVAPAAAAITRPLLLEADGFAFLDAIGVPRTHSVPVHCADEAQRAAHDIAVPVAIKVQATGLAHKSDVGGVRLGVDPVHAAIAYDEVIAETAAATGTTPSGALVQPMAAPGREMLVGVTRSPGFPPVLTVGFGGTAAELYRDVASRTLPAGHDDIRTMLTELRGWPLLTGYRREPAADVEALVDTVARVAAVTHALGERVTEIEINPLLVHDAGAGVTAVDFLLRSAERTC